MEQITYTELLTLISKVNNTPPERLEKMVDNATNRDLDVIFPALRKLNDLGSLYNLKHS